MPKYYEIDEQTARRAKEAYSMSEYKPGSATAEYRAAVDQAAAPLSRTEFYKALDALD